MKQAQLGKKGKKPRKKTDPLAEPIRKKRPNGFFSNMSDEELVGFAQRVMEECGIATKVGLHKSESGCYNVLRKRGLLNRLRFEEKRRDWTSMSDDEIVEHTRKLIGRKEMAGRGELSEVDPGLYDALWKRKLMDKIGLEKQQRDWKSMGDEELVEYAQTYMKQKRITGRTELHKADTGLCAVLRKRELMDSVGFEEKQRKSRDWNSMSDDELVGYAQKIVADKKIGKRSELQRVDRGLYAVLLKRKLIYPVFAAIESDRKREAIQDVLDAMAEFGD